jgi:Glycosyltransferase
MLLIFIKNRFRGARHRLRVALGGVKRRLTVAALSLRSIAMAAVPTIILARKVRSTGPRSRRRIFGQGLATAQSFGRVLAWNLFHPRYLAIVFVNAEHLGPDAEAWVRSTRRLLGGAYVAHRDVAESEDVAGFTTWNNSRGRLHQEIIRNFPDHDAILLDAREPLPDVLALINLKYAAYRSPRSSRIGIVAPARVDAHGELRAGIDYDRQARTWVATRRSDVRDYGQFGIPRFVLAEQLHGLYLTAHYIRTIPGLPDALDDWDDIAASWVHDGWRSGRRTLVYPSAVVETHRTYLPPAWRAEGWQDRRDVRSSDGRVRVIFVLPATTLSGGIRAVLEKADGLSKLGLDVEVWALGPQPTWTEVDLRVVSFRDYASLLDALAPERAIKVATWWETAQVVWLASVNNGVPVQYVQEFESWFYPNDPVGQAAVVANYRREFVYTTTAEYQQGELAEIGIAADIIPPAFDHEVFRERPEIARRDDTLLALGRSFFQKNFALTLAGWRRLGDRRPRLALFGIEPGIVSDSRVEYAFRPSDEEVARLYNSSTAFIQTSIHEGFSLPIVEAMASGCPVITTDSHGNRFCVDDVNCIMVEHDEQQVAAAIERLFADPELRERLRIAGLETAARFTWSVVLAASRDFYESVARDAEVTRS